MSVVLKIGTGSWLEEQTYGLILVSNHIPTSSALATIANLASAAVGLFWPGSGLSTTMRTTFQCDTRRMSVLRGEDQRDIAFSEVLELRVEQFGTDWAIMAHLRFDDRVIVMLPQKGADTVRDALGQIGRSTGLAFSV
jgi:hypothetical protein